MSLIGAKPCPFCDSDNLCTSNSNGSWWVICDGCGIDGPDRASDEESFDAWNNRGVADMNIGDVVWLKSGGPAMTVEKVEPSVVCCWFEGSIFRSQPFPLAALELVTEEAEKAINVVRRLKAECCAQYDEGIYQRIIDELQP